MTDTPLDALCRSVRESARDLLTRGEMSPESSVETLLGIVAEAVDLADRLQAETAARDIADLSRVACAKGCAWCCHLPVGVTAPQALAIAEHVRLRRAAISPETARANLARRIDAPDAPRYAPCAFLHDDLCSIHEIRPFACRGANSVDSGVCRDLVERADGDVMAEREWVHVVPYRTMAAFQDGFRDGLREAGLPDDRLELNRAVSAALADPAAGEKWLAGEDVFASARLHR